MLLNRIAILASHLEFTKFMTMAVVLFFLVTGKCSCNLLSGEPTSSPTNEISAVNDPAAKDKTVSDNGAVSSQSEPALIKPVASVDIGKKLYAQPCAACHGQSGDGKGLAAPFLFPIVEVSLQPMPTPCQPERPEECEGCQLPTL